MNKILLLILSVYLAVSCSSNQRKPLRTSDKKTNTALTPKKPKTNIPADNSLKDFDKGNITKTKMFADGVTVKWFFEAFTKNPPLTDGEVCLINYRISLPDGKIFDGNNRLDLPFIPFMVGYNMQFKGWDLALKHLKVGDFAKIEIPSELAYGTKGFSNIVPANSPIWLYVKVVAKVSPEYNQGGVKTWTFDKGTPGKLDNSADKEVYYHAIVSSKNHAEVQNSFKRKLPLRYALGQKNVVPGLRKVLKNAKKGQKTFVLLNSEQAYGKRGYGKLVQPDESLFYNLSITDIKEF
jgi:FKBP-type peptidyl-prolyl cis-trans isomerase